MNDDPRPPLGATAADLHIARLSDEMTALKITVGVSLGTLEERTQNISQNVQSLAAKPPPGVPIPVLLVLSVPAYFLSIALIILTIWRIQHGG